MAVIGVYDSGIGGLSILRALREELPEQDFVYLADSGHGPYGERESEHVRRRARRITAHLRQRRIDALVVACNTATAAAIEELRSEHPDLPIIGVEPALKPAVQLSRSGRVGVMATRGTVGSDKFARLLANLQGQAQFEVCACNGLALAIEHSTQPSLQDQAETEVARLLRTYTEALAPFGTGEGQIDTLVLGCTHYVFVQDALQQLLGPHVQLVSTGPAVARQTQRLLEQAHLLRQGPAPHSLRARVQLFTTGHLAGLQAAAQRWLQLGPACCHAAGAI